MKRKTKKAPLTPEQKRNAHIFRLRGFYANAKTLPFDAHELGRILECIDGALHRLGAETQSRYMGKEPTKR